MLRGSTLSVRRCLGFTARDRFMYSVYKTHDGFETIRLRFFSPMRLYS
jgi:hypothetical protein